MKVSIEKQSDGSYIAYNTTGDHVTIIGTGDTVREAKEDFFNSIEELKETYAMVGDPIAPCLNEEVEFTFDISSLFEYFSVINVSAFARFIGINESLMRQYRNGSAQLSDKQLEKIEEGIHRLGSEMASLRLV